MISAVQEMNDINIAPLLDSIPDSGHYTVLE